MWRNITERILRWVRFHRYVQRWDLGWVGSLFSRFSVLTNYPLRSSSSIVISAVPFPTRATSCEWDQNLEAWGAECKPTREDWDTEQVGPSAAKYGQWGPGSESQSRTVTRFSLQKSDSVRETCRPTFKDSWERRQPVRGTSLSWSITFPTTPHFAR